VPKKVNDDEFFKPTAPDTPETAGWTPAVALKKVTKKLISKDK